MLSKKYSAHKDDSLWEGKDMQKNTMLFRYTYLWNKNSMHRDDKLQNQRKEWQGESGI